MPVAGLKSGKAEHTADEADASCAENDDGERDVEEKYADEGERCEPNHDAVLERASPNPKAGFQYDRQNGRFEPEEQRDDDRDVAPGGVDVAERHDVYDAGNINETPSEVTRTVAS